MRAKPKPPPLTGGRLRAFGRVLDCLPASGSVALDLAAGIDVAKRRRVLGEMLVACVACDLAWLFWLCEGGEVSR